jgi:hypothetical protein
LASTFQQIINVFRKYSEYSISTKAIAHNQKVCSCDKFSDKQLKSIANLVFTAVHLTKKILDSSKNSDLRYAATGRVGLG